MSNILHIDRNTGTITVDQLTTSRLLSTDGSKALVSSDLASWVAGTSNRVTVTDDGDGTVTLSGPQDIHTGASPQFAGLGLGVAGEPGKFQLLTAQTKIYFQDATGGPNIQLGYIDNVLTGLGCNFMAGGVAGGVNTINGAATSYATISGGYDNILDGVSSSAELDATASTISGGAHNSIKTTHGTIGGGSNNTINDGASYATIGGGTGNTISANATYATIAGGANNVCTEEYSTVGGGTGCKADSKGSIVAGGFGNKVDGTNSDYGTVVGGYQNVISGTSDRSTICGGHSHTITNGQRSTICGGYDHAIAASYATIVGGRACSVSGHYGVALGRRAIVTAQGGWTFADSTDADVTNTTANSLLCRFSGGYTLNGGQLSVAGLISGSNGAKIGDGGTTNYAEIKSDGEVNLHGTARVKQGIWVDANGIKAPGAKPATEISHGDLEIAAWQFANEGVAANQQSVSWSCRIPEPMDRTVAPTVSIGWSADGVSPGNCEWQLEYFWTGPDDDTTQAAAETLTQTTAASATANGMVLTTFTGINAPDASDICMHCRLTRLSAGANDTINDTVELHGACLQYTCDKLGEAT